MSRETGKNQARTSRTVRVTEKHVVEKHVTRGARSGAIVESGAKGGEMGAKGGAGGDVACNHPLAHLAGAFENDPRWAELEEDIEAYRRQMDC